MSGNEEQDRGWCILRMSGARTLVVVQSLAAAGFEVWTPVQTNRIRVPRSSRMVERDAAMLPTFAFARGVHRYDLLRIAVDPASEHPRFGVFQRDGRVRIVADNELAMVRTFEERAKLAVRKKVRRTIVPGTKFALREGCFAGMGGVVDGGNSRFATTSFGPFRAKIATFLLEGDTLEQTEPIEASAAKAA